MTNVPPSLPRACGVTFAVFFTLGLVLPRTSSGISEAQEPALASIPALPAYRPVALPPDVPVTRDPFADSNRAGTFAKGSDPSPASFRVAYAGVLPTLPANRGADGVMPATDSPRGYDGILRLSGVALGERAYALVEIGPDAKIVRVGDTVDGRIVTAISFSGIRLDDGTNIALRSDR